MKGVVIGIVSLILLVINVYAEEDITGVIEKQHIELNQKEEEIKKEAERLRALKKDVEEDILKYTALLKQIETSLKQAEEIGTKRLRHVSKAYEAMPPEDAASRLSGLDNDTAVLILLKMDSKKAGLVIGMMEAQKATQLTKEIAKLKM